MSDLGREYDELKKEVIECRNQSIKTDNQIKNLSLDVRGFEKRFDVLEKRARVTTIGVHGIVALAIATAAYFIAAVSIKDVRESAARQAREASELQKDLASKTVKLDQRLAEIDRHKQKRDTAQTTVTKLISLLDAGKTKEAAGLVDGVDLADLSQLEKQMVAKRIESFRADVSETTYKEGRSLLSVSRKTDAVGVLRRCVKVSPKGRYSSSARYLLGITLRELRRYDEAVEVFSTIRTTEKDTAVLDEVRYWEGYSLARLGRAMEARKILESIVKSGGRHASSAKTQLAALDSDSGAPTTATQ